MLVAALEPLRPIHSDLPACLPVSLLVDACAHSTCHAAARPPPPLPPAEDNPKVLTRCGHAFHLPCLYEWLERSETCPVGAGWRREGARAAARLEGTAAGQAQAGIRVINACLSQAACFCGGKTTARACGRPDFQAACSRPVRSVACSSLPPPLAPAPNTSLRGCSSPRLTPSHSFCCRSASGPCSLKR